MRVALVHDWLVTDAGAEKVLQALCEIYQDADIFTLVDFLDAKSRKNILNGKRTKTSYIQFLPFASTSFRYYLPLFTNAIESFDLKDYDLIISSSWAVAKGVRTHKQQTHICYCHTPVRYAWDLYDEYTKDLKGIKKFFVKETLKSLRKWDLATLSRVDYFIANSHFVADRIKKTYNKESKVIYPPVNTHKFTLQTKKEDYYLTASRLVPYKKTKLIVEAFNTMEDKKLIVIGDGEELESIKKIAKSNIEVLGYKTNDELVEYMQNGSAFVYGAIEDFGIVPIEAMSCGTPVIALNQGGTKETVEDGVTGILFSNQTIQDIKGAINRFEKETFYPDKISQYAQSFNKDRFKNEIKCFIEEHISKQ